MKFYFKMRPPEGHIANYASPRNLPNFSLQRSLVSAWPWQASVHHSVGLGPVESVCHGSPC